MDNMTDGQYIDPLNPDPFMNGTQTADPTGETDIVGYSLQQQIDTEIIQHVTGCQKSSEQWRQEQRLDWDEITDNYEQIYDASGKEAWQSTTFQPLTTTYIERATASLHNMSMGPEAPAEFQARNPEDEQRIEDTNELIQHDLEKSDFKVHWTDFLRTLCTYGTAVGKIDYAREESDVMIKERKRTIFSFMESIKSFMGYGATENTSEVYRQERLIVKDNARFSNRDIFSIYPQPHIEDFTKDTWVIEKFRIKNKELVEGANHQDPYYRLENVTPSLLMSGNMGKTYDTETQSKRFAQLDLDVPMPYSEPELEHDALEYWGPVPRWFLEPELRNDEIRKYEVVNAWIWVVDGQYVVRKRLTPFRDACPPYVKGNYIRRSGQFYGIGIGKLLLGLQGEKNETRNTRADNINLILNKIVAIAKDKIAREDYDRLKSGPGAVWPFKQIDDIRKAVFPIDFPDITQDSWRASAEIDRESQEVTDVVKTTQTIGAGEDMAGNGTFRGQLLNKQQSNDRFMLYARIMEIMGLNAALNKYWQRIYQFKSYEQIERILGKQRGKQYELITPEELCNISKIVSLGSLTNENKGLRLAQMREFFVLAQGKPYFKEIDFLRKMYRLIGQDPDEVLFTDQELKQFNDMRRMMMTNSMFNGTPPEAGASPMTDDGMPMPNAGPIAGDTPPPMDGMARPAMPARGPGASSIDGMGTPLS